MKKVLLIIFAIIFIFFGWRVVVYFGDIAKTAVQEEMALAQVSGEGYVFYYPKGWIEEEEPGAVLTYFAVNEQGEETGESISLEISEGNSQSQPATEELCQTFAQGLVSVNPNLPGQAVSIAVSSTHPTYEGCKIVSQFNAGGLITMSEIKAIWYKDRRNNTMYLSNAAYFADTTEDTKAVIKDAVNTFSIR